MKLLKLFTILIIAASCQQKSSDTLLIATAANMQYAMNAIVTEFTKQTGIKCELIIGSSGKLTAQIQEGAPFDVFVSADIKYPDELYKKGFAQSEPSVYAYGYLVLWTFSDRTLLSLDSLHSDAIQHIAVANPKTAPYGVAALSVLQKLDLLEQMENKLVYGESIAQTNQFITTQAAQVGFTAKSVVLSPHLSEKGNWIDVDAEKYTPIEQGIVLLKAHPEHFEFSKQFYNFLYSPSGQSILEQFGYKTIKN